MVHVYPCLLYLRFLWLKFPGCGFVPSEGFSGLGLPAKNLIILVVVGTGKGYDSKLCQLKGRGWRVKFWMRIPNASLHKQMGHVPIEP